MSIKISKSTLLSDFSLPPCIQEISTHLHLPIVCSVHTYTSLPVSNNIFQGYFFCEGKNAPKLH